MFCFLCQDETETVGHFILRCPKYQATRSEVYKKLAVHDPRFSYLNDDDKLRYILDARCHEENLGACCNFLFTIYKQRENYTLLRQE